MEKNQVPASWFVDVLKLGVAKAYGSDLDTDALAWQEDALCAQTDPEAFFPEKGGSTRDAKRICAQCTVRAECLEYALKNDERFGIWGGLSERERRRLRRCSSFSRRISSRNTQSAQKTKSPNSTGDGCRHRNQR
jgi:WhiB family redox-sensing transcriptional regulator